MWSRILFFQQRQAAGYWDLNLRDSIAQRKEYSLFGIDGLVDEEPMVRVIPNKLLKEEEEAIIDYALIYPEQRHREIQFNLDQEHLTLRFLFQCLSKIKGKESC